MEAWHGFRPPQKTLGVQRSSRLPPHFRQPPISPKGLFDTSQELLLLSLDILSQPPGGHGNHPRVVMLCALCRGSA